MNNIFTGCNNVFTGCSNFTYTIVKFTILTFSHRSLTGGSRRVQCSECQRNLDINSLLPHYRCQCSPVIGANQFLERNFSTKKLVQFTHKIIHIHHIKSSLQETCFGRSCSAQSPFNCPIVKFSTNETPARALLHLAPSSCSHLSTWTTCITCTSATCSE